MSKFDSETAVAAIELKQMLADYWYEVDHNLGRNAAAFYAEDGVAVVSAGPAQGHAAITQYYATLEQNRLNQGGRSVRHAFANVGITFEGKDRAVMTCLTFGFAGPGKPPVVDGTTPVAVSDGRYDCRRDADGQWRIVRYAGTPKFIGGDAFTKNALKNAPR